MLHVKKPRKKMVFFATITIFVIGIIGISIAVWATNNSQVAAEPIAHEGIEVATEKEPIVPEGIGGSFIHDDSLHDFTFEALDLTEQKQVTKEMAHYYLDEEGNVVHFTELNTENIPFESLNAEQKKQAKKEIGHYSLAEVRAITRGEIE